jgi:hypothetical protein
MLCSIHCTFLLKGIHIPSAHSTNEIQIEINSPNKQITDQVKVSGSGMLSPKLPLKKIFMQN